MQFFAKGTVLSGALSKVRQREAQLAKPIAIRLAGTEFGMKQTSCHSEQPISEFDGVLDGVPGHHTNLVYRY